MSSGNSSHDRKSFSRETENDGHASYDPIPPTSSKENVKRTFRYRTFLCPHCQTRLSVTKEDVGKIIVCPDCDREVTVPNYLDFDTPTEYELQYYNQAKHERDRLLSPLTNPNRVGLATDSDDVYSLDDASHKESSIRKDVEYYPVLCRVCGTLMQATKADLGKVVVCPDCGSKTIVTDSLKKQQDALDVKFQPRDRGAYDIGEIPDAPAVFVQKMNGQIVSIDPNHKTIAPKSSKSKSGVVDHKRSDSYDDLSFLDPTEETSTTNRKRARDEQAKRRTRKSGEEDLSKFLPKMTLRRKNGELVWALPSPPKIAPMFNKTFQAVASEEIWARAGTVALCILGYILIDYYVIRPNIEISRIAAGSFIGAFAQLETLVFICVLTILTIASSSISGLFFWSVYNCGNSGAKKVVEWRKEDLTGFFGYGLWFLAFVVFSSLPGTLLGTFIVKLVDVGAGSHFLNSSIPLENLSKIIPFVSCFWLFFPVFWISTHQTDLPFCPVTLGVLTSFVSKFHNWLQFYAFSAVFFLVPSLVLLAIFGSFAFLLLAPIIFPTELILYGLFLGRLSWILDDEVRSMEYDD